MCKTKQRIRKTLVSLSLVVAILILGISQTIAYASEPESYSTCAEHYFSKLQNDIPDNLMGSCVYVALTMMLSFYDMYWHDIFVPDNFEGEKGLYGVGSTYPIFIPQIKLENDFWEAHKEELADYSSLIANYASEYLHLYLINLSIELGYNTSTPADESYGISIAEAKILLEYYLSLQGITSEQVSVHTISESLTVSRSDVLNAVRTQVQAGNPVYFRGTKIENTSDVDTGIKKSGHAMVAYGIDGDDIKLHTGWIDRSIQDDEIKYVSSVNTTEYQYNIGALWLEINESAFPHVCSYSFQEMATSKMLCSCQAYHSLHDEHTHKRFKYVKNSYTLSGHNSQCICDTIFEEWHAYTYVDQTTNHLRSCDCGYVDVESHTYENISIRLMRCRYCGYTTERNQSGLIIKTSLEEFDPFVERSKS